MDEYLEVRGLESVFAIGDVAVYPQILHGGKRRFEHWNVAGNHRRAVGKTILETLHFSRKSLSSGAYASILPYTSSFDLAN